MQENTISSWIRQLDRLLRGEATRLSALRQGIIEISPDGLAVVIFVLGLLYGACMGCYGVFQKGGINTDHLAQWLSTIGKIPLLFALTVVVTFPSLYVFNALVGSRLSLSSVLRLIIAALAIIVTVLASFGPIVAFFSASTTSYPFMLLLNVAVFAISGLLGAKFLLHTLHRLTEAQDQSARQELAPATLNEPIGALDKMDDRLIGRNVVAVFQIWILVFGLVGSQMAWVLRPFIGAPNTPFSLFRLRESNFFEAVWHALNHLLS